MLIKAVTNDSKAFNKKIGNNFLTLIIIYVCTHFLLCLISGQWWDDWFYWINGAEKLKTAYLESAMPLQAYNILSVMWIPNWGYRIIVFILFLIIGLLFYSILKSLDFISEEDAFWISAIAMSVPVNDARTILNCFGYTLSLFIFFVGFYIVTKLSDFTGKKEIMLKIASLFLLVYSYTTESLLVFTFLIWIYLFYINRLKHKEKKLKYRISNYFKSYWCFIITPFVYYVIKRILFKPNGNYEGYNIITVDSLVRNTIKSPISAVITLCRIGFSYIKQIGITSVAVFVIIAVVYLIYRRKNNNSNDDGQRKPIKKQLFLFAIGTAVYYAGVFAYLIIRGRDLDNKGVGGRDSMLAGFGIAIMAFAFIRCLPVKKTIQNLICWLLVILGIFYFNNTYLEYQEDWYHQKEFAYSVLQNSEFDDDNIILCDFSYETPISTKPLYALTGMSYKATGKMNKLYFGKVDDIWKKEIYFHKLDLSKNYYVDDCDFSDTTIDAVLIIDNEHMSQSEVLKFKFYELFRPNTYEKEIQRLTDAEYIRINKELSDHIYDLSKNNKLTSQVLREEISQYAENNNISNPDHIQ